MSTAAACGDSIALAGMRAMRSRTSVSRKTGTLAERRGLVAAVMPEVARVVLMDSVNDDPRMEWRDARGKDSSARE